jgi:hypothetical protein
MLGSVVVGSVSAGTVFAERPASEDPPVAAAILLGGSVLLLAVGFGLRTGATRQRDIHVSGIRGRAFIRSMRATESSLSGMPIYEIDMDVTGPGVEPFRTMHLEPIPRLMAETLHEGATVPILIDESAMRRVALDWVSAPSRIREGFAEEPDEAGSSPVVDESPPIAATGTPTAGTRIVALVVVMVLLAAGANVLGSLLDSSDDVPEQVVPSGIYESTSLGSVGGHTRVGASARNRRGRDVGYSFVLPEG